MSELPFDRIVLFDGECAFCAASVQFVLRRDPGGLFRFAPLQSALGRDLCARHGVDPEALDTFVLVTRDGAFVRSDAALAVARELGAPWRVLAALGRLVPRPLRDWAYGVVARNRYRWFGRRDACLVPPDDARSRFLV